MVASSRKEKLVEDAQKFALRGQFDKAAKIYEQILALDPTAINQRQKFAELLIRCGRSDDARKELELIGGYFSKNGFYLKAIAVYKQLQKLFPTDISLSMTLAGLNEKHGLVANALSEYKLVFDYYEKSGHTADALGVLEKMLAVDPQNISIQMRLAEAYAQWGRKTDSYGMFAKAASLLLERSDKVTLARLCSRVSQIFPDKPDFILDVLSGLVNRGNAAAATEGIQNLLRENPHNKGAWDLIVRAYQQLEQPQRVKIAYQHYLKFFPSEPAAILGLITSIAGEHNVGGTLALLDRYENALISEGCTAQLEQIYHTLEAVDPINDRVMEGLTRFAAASGTVVPLTVHPPESAPVTELFAVSDPLLLSPEEEIEIDLEIDFDSPFGSTDGATDAVSLHADWLDSVGNLFDTIDTAPRSVKFGSEMEGSDAQVHYDLGQAFKEMGLFDEAINEFRQASQESSRRVECLILQCACLRDRGEVEKAITMLLALIQPGLSEEEVCAVKYELATGYEAAGNIYEANLLLNEIHTTNPDFRDINSRIDAANQLDSIEFSDDDLKNF